MTDTSLDITPRPAAGVLIGSLINVGLSQTWVGWRFAFANVGILAAVMFLQVLFLCESPVWLAMQEGANKALDAEADPDVLYLKQVAHAATSNSLK